jgi:hypothetical protein
LRDVPKEGALMIGRLAGRADDRARFPILAIVVFLSAATFVGLAWHWNFVAEDGRRYFILYDDAMISMRYAYNLANFGELAWNHSDRVQGYTNLGWTLVMAGVHLVGLPLEINSLVIQGLNLLLHTATAGYVAVTMGRRFGLRAGMASGVLVAVNYPMLIWGSLGMETALQALLVSGAIIPWLCGKGSAMVEPRTLALLTALFVVRADGFVLLAVSIGLGLLSRRERTRSLVVASVMSLTVVLAVFSFQWLYYADPVPNTFHLKVSGGAESVVGGVRYIWTFLTANGQFGLCLSTGGLLWLSWRTRVDARRFLAPVAMLVVWFSYVVSVGGDVHGGSRFLVPIIPTLICCGVAFIAMAPGKATTRPGRRVANAAALGSAVALVWGVLSGLNTLFIWGDWFYLAEFARGQMAVKETIDDLALADGRTVAIFAAGTVPYFEPRLRFHDLLGKSDRHIANSRVKWGAVGHNKWDFDYSLNVVRPDVVVEGGRCDETERARNEQFVAERAPYKMGSALCLDENFERLYARDTVVAVHEGMTIWVRRRVG